MHSTQRRTVIRFLVRLFGSAAICFAEPIAISKLGREAAIDFNSQIANKMHEAEQAALMAVGRI